ncbi:cache domain-containing sensor histidine kinase [Hespellia stercorisuis]|uniref:histidine kinase n=1 Tax=Hespellia stercorisuis DSM 15480 TaxID=1121950 RepID=A0A1M6RC73_9FIRM|nr:sensor histidine kinase [Hespellia stercorisuis]SHK29938.1 two-component system, sensor histidine kinase YesM [Hespellia stercorisuis DSM 15480]
MKRWIRNLELKKKFIFYTYIVITPVLLLISGLILEKNYEEMTLEQNAQGENQVNNLAGSLEELNQNMIEMSTYIGINSDVNEILNAPNAEELNQNPQIWLDEAPMRFVQDILAIKGYVKTWAIYPENGVRPYLRCIDSSVSLPTIEAVRETDAYQRALTARGKVCWAVVGKSYGDFYEANRTEKMVLYREVFDLSGNKRLGYMTIGADIEKYREICESVLDYRQDGAVLLNRQGEVLLTGGRIGDQTKAYLEGDGFGKHLQEDGTTYFHHGNQMIYVQRSDDNSFITCTIIPDSAVNKQLLSVFGTALAFLTVVLVGLFPVLSLISNIVTKPLGMVEQAMKKFRGGDFSQQVEVDTQDEVGRMAECFNQMVTDIRILIEENYVMQLKEKESELTALQAQINPHFLYNALDTLYWQAVNGGNDELAENVLTLSNLFRLVLGKGKGVVCVSQEIELIEEYLKIQKMRFTGRLTYEIDLDERIAGEQIPKLILQPFVENAVVHGFENSEAPCEIYVTAEQTEDGMEFVIRDTGIGMTDEQIRQIFQAESAEDAERYKGQRIGGYAMKNVRERLELRYRGRFKLLVDSVPGEGTKITIRLPRDGQ